MSVLLAKVKVNLKRASALREALSKTKVSGESSQTAEQGMVSLTLDPATMSAVRNGEQIPLKAKEFALLNCLYEHRGTIVKKEQLFDEVWGDTFYTDGTLNVHIRKLREKLEDDPNEPKLIKTVWGTGYILETGV
jgi:two-component system response regulator RegX3